MWLINTLFLFTGLVAAFDVNNHFLSPAEGSSLIWRAGTTQSIQWTTNATTGYNISLWQQSPLGGSAALLGPVYATTVQASGSQQFSWVVDYSGANLTYSSVFFLWANRGNTPVWSSAYFNITRAAVVTGGVTSTISTSPSTSTPTLTLSIIPSGGVTGGETASASATSTSAPGNSNATAIGAGVGAGVGAAILILAGLLVFFWRRRKQQRRDAANATTIATTPLNSDPYDDSVDKRPYHDAPAELADPNSVAEAGKHGKHPSGLSAHEPTVYHEVDGTPPVREMA